MIEFIFFLVILPLFPIFWAINKILVWRYDRYYEKHLRGTDAKYVRSGILKDLDK